jgi:single-strand DNA-binding protein
MGRLTRDPELRRTNSGKPVAGFTVAVDRDYAPDGQERETDFIDCVAWNGTAEFVEKYFKKGGMIVVSGRLQLRNWTDKDGNKRRSAEILASSVYFGEGKKSQEGNNPTQSQYNHPGSNGNPGAYQNQPPQNYGGYPQYPQQSYQQPAPNVPNYSQQGFGGYQQPAFQGQMYRPPHPQQGSFAVMDDDDPHLPF